MTLELTTNQFEHDVLESNVPVLVDFWSPGCGPCRLQDPILKELADESEGRFQVKKVNVWDEPDLATQFEISAVPTLMVFDQGKVVRTLVGYQDKNRLLKVLQEAV